MKKNTFKFIIEKTNTGYSAYSHTHPVFSTGESIPEIIENIYEAVSLYDSEISREQVSFSLDFKQFFKFYGLVNAKGLARRINMNPTLLSQYVQGVKTPSPKQQLKILGGIRDLGRELRDIELVYHGDTEEIIPDTDDEQ